MGSSPIDRTNKKKTPPIGGVFFLLAPTARSWSPTATITFKLMQNCGAVEKNAAFACKMLLLKQQGILQAWRLCRQSGASPIVTPPQSGGLFWWKSCRKSRFIKIFRVFGMKGTFCPPQFGIIEVEGGQRTRIKTTKKRGLKCKKI